MPTLLLMLLGCLSEEERAVKDCERACGFTYSSCLLVVLDQYNEEDAARNDAECVEWCTAATEAGQYGARDDFATCVLEYEEPLERDPPDTSSCEEVLECRDVT